MITLLRVIYENEAIPDGYQLVPIRELIQSWSTTEFLQASRAVQLLEWRRNHKFCSHCGHMTEIHAKNTQWFAQLVAIINILAFRLLQSYQR